MPSTQVLIVGAGPTGLVLALRLARHGVPFRIIDRGSGPGLASRAVAVQARTLEFYRQLGFADEVVALGIPMRAVHLREEGEEVASIPLAELGAALSPYPFALCFPQDDHERFLTDRLEAAGAAVEWGVELRGFTQDDGGVHAILTQDGVESRCEAAYICGCDGAHSQVRESLGLGFPGGTYRHLFYVADVAIEGGFRTDVYVNLDRGGLALMFPVRSRGMQRLIGIVPEEVGKRDGLTFEDVRPAAEAVLGVRVTQVNWFSTYHVHHRVADHFRGGRAFIAGDAGHIHSPAGGQGMNTGIGDAVNLSWKLAEVLGGRAAPAILDSYETERIAFARSLVATTDRAFQGLVNSGPGGRFLRGWVMPKLLPALTGFAAFRRLLFRTVSQIRIAYPDSTLSEGKAGEVSGGDRLPWVPGAPGAASDNFAPFAGLDWRLQVYGMAEPGLAATAARLGLPLDAIPWTEVAGSAGLLRDGAYLVRPDMHIALALAEQDPDRLQSFAARHGLSFGRAMG
jgi:2-polyprenyl-6-methoxyphenol hydroxylase-like FAD-dependent oxidoreductase